MKLWFTFIITAVLLAACGKKGPVEPLEQSEYPRSYPKPVARPFPPQPMPLAPDGEGE